MLDQVLEAQGYLRGEGIVKNNMYRACYLLAKWHKEQGLAPVDIRRAILDWAREYHVAIGLDLNMAILKAANDRDALKGGTVVRVGEDDIKEITDRFDSHKSRLVALAVLCYAKVYADKDRSFHMSAVALGSWLGISNSVLGSRYMKELIEFGYVSRADAQGPRFSWRGKGACHKYYTYTMLVPLRDSGGCVLVGNAIHDLYALVFGR